MNLIDFDTALFPSYEKSVRALWAPLLLSPISGSPEQFVIGCAVVGASDFHVEMANATSRLHCLYGDQAEAVILAIELAEQSLISDLTARGKDAILSPRSALSGLALGEVREAEGLNLKHIGSCWMSVISSIYSTISDAIALVDDSSLGTSVASDPDLALPKSLPTLIMHSLVSSHLGLRQFFSDDIKFGRRHRRSAGTPYAPVDFAGNRLVANFTVLRPKHILPSVDKIKQRLWDLRVERKRDEDLRRFRNHELIVQVPSNDDPKVTPKQFKNIDREFNFFEEQADKDSLRLQRFTSISDITQHILKLEAA